MIMQYPALIKPVENQFRATAAAPFDVTAFGTTEAEALERLDAEISERLRHGAKIVQRHIMDAETHPLAQFAGDLAEQPLAEDWQDAIKKYRQEAEIG